MAKNYKLRLPRVVVRCGVCGRRNVFVGMSFVFLKCACGRVLKRLEAVQKAEGV